MTRLIGVLAVPNCWVASAFVLLTSFSALLQQQCVVEVWALRPSRSSRSPSISSPSRTSSSSSSPSGRRAARVRGGQPLLQPPVLDQQGLQQAAGSSPAAGPEVDLEAGGGAGSTLGNQIAPAAASTSGGGWRWSRECANHEERPHHEGADVASLLAGAGRPAALLVPAAAQVQENENDARDHERRRAEGDGGLRRVRQERLDAIERDLQWLGGEQRKYERLARGARRVRNVGVVAAGGFATAGTLIGGTARGAGAAVSSACTAYTACFAYVGEQHQRVVEAIAQGRRALMEERDDLQERLAVLQEGRDRE